MQITDDQLAALASRFAWQSSDDAGNEPLGLRQSPVPHSDGETLTKSRSAVGSGYAGVYGPAGGNLPLGPSSGVVGGGDDADASGYFAAPESHYPSLSAGNHSSQGNPGYHSAPTTINKAVSDWASIVVQEPGNQRFRPSPWIVDTNEYVKHFKGTTFIAIGSIAKKVAQQEAKVMRRIRKKSGLAKEPVAWDHPLVQLFEQVNPIHTQFDLWYQMVAWRLLTGNSYWWKARNGFGKPAELWPLPSQWVWAIPSSKKFISEYLVRGVFGGVDRYIDAGDVLHIREMSIDWNGPGRFYGTPMAAAAATAIDLEEAMLQRLYFQFKNFNPPGMQYSTEEKLTESQFVDMMLQIRMQQHTAEQTGAPILTHSGVKAQEFKNTVREMDYSQSLQTVMSYILAMFGTPQAVVGVSREYSRSNLVGALLSWAENTINPLLRHMGQHLTQGLARDYDEDLVIEFDPIEVADADGLRADVAACQSAGAITPNEVRETLLKKSPFVGGGDKPYKPAGAEEASYGNPAAEGSGGDGNGGNDGGIGNGQDPSLPAGQGGADINGNIGGAGGGAGGVGGPTPSVDPFTGLESTGEYTAQSGDSANAASGEASEIDDEGQSVAASIDGNEAAATAGYMGPGANGGFVDEQHEGEPASNPATATPRNDFPVNPTGQPQQPSQQSQHSRQPQQPRKLNGPDGVSAIESSANSGYSADEIPDDKDGGETPADDITPRGADKGVEVPEEYQPEIPHGQGRGMQFSLGGEGGDPFERDANGKAKPIRSTGGVFGGGTFASAGEGPFGGNLQEDGSAGIEPDNTPEELKLPKGIVPRGATPVHPDDIDMLMAGEPDDGEIPEDSEVVGVDDIDMLLADDDGGGAVTAKPVASGKRGVAGDDGEGVGEGDDEQEEGDGEQEVGDDDEGDDEQGDGAKPKKPRPKKPSPKKPFPSPLAKSQSKPSSPEVARIAEESRSQRTRKASIENARRQQREWAALQSHQEAVAAQVIERFLNDQQRRILAGMTKVVAESRSGQGTSGGNGGELASGKSGADIVASLLDWSKEDRELFSVATKAIRESMEQGFRFAFRRVKDMRNERRRLKEIHGTRKPGSKPAGEGVEKSLVGQSANSLSSPLAKATNKPKLPSPTPAEVSEFLIDIPQAAREAAEDMLSASLSQPYWQSVNQTTTSALERIINAGIDAHKSAQAIASEISERLGPSFNRKRAITIARTEITTALNTAQISVMNEAMKSPYMEPFALEWLSGDDDKTRPSHVRAHGQIIIPGVEKFKVGSETCDFPGQLTLSAKERINCRCAFVEVFPEDLPEGHPVRVKLEEAADDKGVELVDLSPDMWYGTTGRRQWSETTGLGGDGDWMRGKPSDYGSEYGMAKSLASGEDEAIHFQLANQSEAIELSKSSGSKNTFSPPAGAQGNARKVLAWKKEHGSKVKGMTAVGWARARQLASGKPISLATVRRMASFNRHQKNYDAARRKQKAEGGKPWEYAGIVAWLGWGGSSGMSWAKGVSGKSVGKRGEGSLITFDDIFSSRWLSDYVEVLKRFNKDQPRDKNGRFTHAGSAGASAAAKEKYKPSELVASKMEEMRFIEHGRAAEVVAQMKSEKNKKAADDYQAAYDAGYKEAAKVRRKMLAKSYYENKKQEKWKAKREAAIEAANKASNDYSDALDKFKEEYEKEHGQSSTISIWEAWSASSQRETLIQDLRKKQAIAESVDKKWREVASSSADKVVSILGVPPESRIGITHRMAGREDVKASKAALNRAYASRVKAGNKKELAGKSAEAENFLSAILAKESDNSTSKDIKVFGLSARGSQRAFAYEHGVYLSSRNDVGTFVHEMGHVLESDPGFAALAQGFLVKRCGDEKPHVMRRDKRGNPEWGREDDFTKVFGDNAGYVGRHYPHASTEIFSMGLEQLYRDPVKFAKNDPEYFNFVVGAMRGHIKAKSASTVA